MSAMQRRYVQFKLMFHNSHIQARDSIVEVAHLLISHGLLPADGVVPNIHPVDDIEDLVRSHTRHHDNFWLWIAIFPIVVKDKPDLIAGLWFECIDPRQNRLSIHSLADFEFKDQRQYVEPFAQRLKDLGLALYPLVQPTLGWVDESFSNETDTKESLKLKLRTISWVNFFGPAYIQRYGQDFLLGLPGYKTELLPDGGVFYQLSPTFVATSEKEAKVLRRQVIAYCAGHGLKVTCRAPHYIAGVSPTPTPEPIAPVSNAEVRTYLKQALATTLVLTDGTRVKPIYILWDDLTPRQRQMALDAIQRAAIAEIKRPGRKRIRFEFNEIPDDLDQTLADLVGRDNPDFEWVQVDMAPPPTSESEG
jgi:hypothetical protein